MHVHSMSYIRKKSNNTNPHWNLKALWMVFMEFISNGHNDSGTVFPALARFTLMFLAYSGALSNAITTSVVQPLDVIKTTIKHP